MLPEAQGVARTSLRVQLQNLLSSDLAGAQNSVFVLRKAWVSEYLYQYGEVASNGEY